MNTKSLRCLLTVLFLAGLAVVPLGAAGQEETAAAPDEPVVLTFKLRPNSPGFDPDVAEDIAEFERMTADAGTPVTVDLQYFAGPHAEYTTKNTLELRSGQGPDLLFEETGGSQNYMRAGFLMPLDDYVADWELWDQVIEPFRRWMGYDGHVYMIPIQSSAIPLYYRKDLFAQAGLPTEWQPTSWQEILDAAEQVKASLPGVTPLLFIGGKEAGAQVTFSRFNLLFNGAGGLLYDYDDEKWVVTSQPLLDVFEFYQTMAERGLLNPERAVGGQANDWSIEAFQNGTGAINLYGSWAYMFHWNEGRSHPIPDLQDTVGYARMPAMEPGASYRGQDWVSQSGGWNYMIPASSTERADTAWELIKFLSATERQAKYNATKGQAATRWDVMQHPTFQANPFLAETSTWLEYTYMKPHFVAGFAGGPENAIREAIGRIIIGEWTGREAMQNFAREMEQLMGPDKVKHEIDL